MVRAWQDQHKAATAEGNLEPHQALQQLLARLQFSEESTFADWEYKHSSPNDSILAKLASPLQPCSIITTMHAIIKPRKRPARAKHTGMGTVSDPPMNC